MLKGGDLYGALESALLATFSQNGQKRLLGQERGVFNEAMRPLSSFSGTGITTRTPLRRPVKSAECATLGVYIPYVWCHREPCMGQAVRTSTY